MLIQIDKKEDINKLDKNLKSSIILPQTIKQELEMNPYGHYLLDIEANEIIAYLYYSVIYDRAEINQIEVTIIHRNCGKASKLLEKMIKLVDKNITLEVKKDNINAIHLYQKYNFQKVAIRKGYYQGIDGILMERKKEDSY